MTHSKRESVWGIILKMTDSEQASTTPILDLVKPLPKPQGDGLTLRNLVLPLLLVALAVLTGHSALLMVALGLLLISFLLTAVHELGHLIAGLSVGLQFEAVEVGPLRIERESGRWKLRTRHHLLTGFTFMSLDKIRRVRRRLIVLILGGPTASLLSGVAALLALP